MAKSYMRHCVACLRVQVLWHDGDTRPCTSCGGVVFGEGMPSLTQLTAPSRVTRKRAHTQDCNVWVGCQQCDGPDLTRLCTCTPLPVATPRLLGKPSGTLSADVRVAPAEKWQDRLTERDKDFLHCNRIDPEEA